MLKREIRVISIRISDDDYVKLQAMQTKARPSVSFIVREAIEEYIQKLDSPQVIKPIELKPLENLRGPAPVIQTFTLPQPLIIPTIMTQKDSPVISSAYIGGDHKLERKIKPDMYKVRLAYRAKMRGTEYDTTLEQYFPDLNG